LPPETNRPPYFVDETFEKIAGKVQYFEGDEISFSWAASDADDDDKDLLRSTVVREGDMKLVDYMVTAGYLDLKEHTFKYKVDFKKDPILENQIVPLSFEITDGTLILPKQILLEFTKKVPVEVVEEVVPEVLSVADIKIVEIKKKEKKGLIDRTKFTRKFQARLGKVGDMGEFEVKFTSPAIVFGDGKLPDNDVLEIFYEK